MSNRPRREERPDRTAVSGRGDVPMNDPGYHYRILSREDEVIDRVAHHKTLGYGVAGQSGRAIVMGCRKEEHERRQSEAALRADRMRAARTSPTGEMVHDETTIEVTRGVRSSDED